MNTDRPGKPDLTNEPKASEEAPGGVKKARGHEAASRDVSGRFT